MKTLLGRRDEPPESGARDRAILDLQNTGMRRILNAVVGGIIVIVILAAMTPVFFDAVADLVANLTPTTNGTGENATTTQVTGITAVDTLLEAFAPVIAIIAALVFLGLVLAALRQNR